MKYKAWTDYPESTWGGPEVPDKEPEEMTPEEEKQHNEKIQNAWKEFLQDLKNSNKKAPDHLSHEWDRMSRQPPGPSEFVPPLLVGLDLVPVSSPHANSIFLGEFIKGHGG